MLFFRKVHVGATLDMSWITVTRRVLDLEILILLQHYSQLFKSLANFSWGACYILYHHLLNSLSSYFGLPPPVIHNFVS